jgi:hypothetical protein
MSEERFRFPRDWVEPAHPVAIKLHDDLTAIYKYIRERYQKEIDAAFDDISRQIGFVVTTTVPVVLEMGEEGAVKSVGVGARNLQGTLFEKIPTLLSLGDPIPARAGSYYLYLIWFEALKLKLRTDWVEPAHFRRPGQLGTIQPGAVSGLTRAETGAARVRPEVMEPAHWFDPGLALAGEEAVLISVIDDVYPELRLMDRVVAVREAARIQVRPEVKEPAHFRTVEPGLPAERTTELLSELAAVLRRFGL